MKIDTQVPEIRLRLLNDQPIDSGKQWVVYWMTAFRRTRSNFALQHARDVARHLQRPLVVVEALRVHYRWASDRFHRFVIEGMVDNAAACESSPVHYYPYVEPQPGEGSGLMERLAEDACAVITDDYPCFFHPRMLAVVAKKLASPLIAVDACCLMPLRATERIFTVAHSYRRFMQKELPRHLEQAPEPNPLDGRLTHSIPELKQLPKEIRTRWPAAKLTQLLREGGLSSIPIDHAVARGAVQGGADNARRMLDRFIDQRLTSYEHDRNEPDDFGSSELSPHLHFGHIGPHEVFFRVMEHERWHVGKLHKPNGKMNGFWNVGTSAEAFLDQLCTWREIGFNMCVQQPDYDRYRSLPDWAQKTLAEHADDPRPHRYSLEQFELAKTSDPLWNAAQRQLVREGRIHNYMRMLWGKKILHWSESPQAALDIMLHLNNKYALDGRDPNSYSGIFWVLGRYDRAWGPEREIFGKIRYMTSDSTAKKHQVKQYIERYSQ